jgi:ABC-type uncharacterized transport system ATPase subunit
LREKLGVIAIVHRGFPLISNLSVLENIMLVGSYHLAKDIKSLEDDIALYLKKFDMGLKVHFRKESLTEFEDFVVRFLQARHSYFKFIFVIDELGKISEENRDRFLNVIDKEKNDNIVFIEYNRYKDYYRSYKTVTLGDYKID